MGAPQLDNVSDSEFIGLELRLRKTLKDAGGASSLTHSILSMLINKSYSHASKEIDMYLELKSEYPQLAEFTKRYVDRAKHIIEDIEERRNIPTENMSMTKVQAIHDREKKYTY